MRIVSRPSALACLYLLCATSLLAQPTSPTTASLTAAPRLFRLSSTFHPADGLAAAAVENATLAIYAQESGGLPLWQETQNVAVDSDGGYVALLGLTQRDGLSLALFATGEPRWLGVQFQREGESEQPRILLTSVPYALLAAKAVDAETLGGRPASAYQLAGVSAGTPAGRGAAVTLPAAAPPAALAGAGATAPVQSASVTRKFSAGTPGTIGKFTNATDLGDSVLSENGGKIGLGNTTPLDFMHVQFTDGGGVFTGYGVRNLSAAATAYSGMLFFDQNGALAQFQGFNNATHEYRINNIASSGTINFMLGSASKFLVRADGDVEMPGSIRKGGALFLHNLGGNNFAAGLNALQAGTGFSNVATGTNALKLNTSGDSNAATGAFALQVNTTGSGNVATGTAALAANTTGNTNVATGNIALFSNTTGNNNVATGNNALDFNTTGSSNVATGLNALASNTTGNFNTAIGANADVSSGALVNATAIGHGAVVDASHKIRLGNANVTVIEGEVAFTFPSDKTRKENFKPADPEEVLRKVAQLPVSSWNYIGHDPQVNRHYGPMAQDFYAAFGDDGVGRIGTATTINSGDWSAVLMLAVQALGQRTEAQIARIVELEQDRQAQIARVAALEQDREAQIPDRRAQTLEMRKQTTRIEELELERQVQSAALARQYERIAALEKQASEFATVKQQMAELQAATLAGSKLAAAR